VGRVVTAAGLRQPDVAVAVQFVLDAERGGQAAEVATEYQHLLAHDDHPLCSSMPLTVRGAGVARQARRSPAHGTNGTPAIIESIRAGLVFALKQAVGTDLIQAREERFWRRALQRWERHSCIEILGNHDAPRLSIVSFRIRVGPQYDAPILLTRGRPA
jgi:selenocysteine lyase/cysteine desulfurase